MNNDLYKFLTTKQELFKELEIGIKSLERGDSYSSKEVYEELDKI